MQKELAQQLYKEAKDLANKFSDPNRSGNNNNETFKVKSIHPLSDLYASVIFEKSNGKQALAQAMYIYGYKRWEFVFLTDSHLLGMQKIFEYKYEVEKHNFKFNFKKEAPQPKVTQEDLYDDFEDM